MPDTQDLYASYQQVGNQFVAIVRVPWFSTGRPYEVDGEVQKYNTPLEAQIAASVWLCSIFRNRTTGWRENPLTGQISANQEWDELFSKGVKA